MLYFQKGVSSRISNVTRTDRDISEETGPKSRTCVLVLIVLVLANNFCPCSNGGGDGLCGGGPGRGFPGHGHQGEEQEACLS